MPAPQPSPTRSPTNQLLYPIDLSRELGEPPAWPTPKPTPTPAAQTAAPATSTLRPNPNASTVGEEIDPADVVRINSNLVTIPTSAVDASGRAVTDLKLEDFELRVDGQPKPISDLGRSDTPVRMALLFDNSQSLTSTRDLEKQAAIKFFRTVMRPVDLAAIYSVSTESALEQPMTNNVPSLVHTIERFGLPAGSTTLFDCIADAANYLRSSQGRRVIVIISDGEDTTSNLTFDETLQRVLGTDCQIYIVQTGVIENANLRPLIAERRMETFANLTGGFVYTPSQVSDLDAAFAQIAADLAQQYVLGYYADDDRSGGQYHTLNVRVITRPNMRVRARKGFYPKRAANRAS